MGALIPTTTDPTEYSGASSATHNVPWPAGVQAGDLLLLEINSPLTTTLTSAPDWTAKEATFHVPTLATYFRVRKADGTESGTFTLTFGAAAQIATQQYVIPAAQWSGDFDTVLTADASGSSDAPNPPEVAPGLGAHGWLGLVFVCANSQAVTASDTSDDYSTAIDTDSSSALRMWSQRRSLDGVASEDPTAWTLSGSATWTARTVLVQGVDLEPTVLSPARGARGVDVDTNLVMTFPVDVQAGSGTISIVELGGDENVFASYDVGDAEVDFTDNVVTISPASNLSTKGYRVVVSPGAIEAVADSAPYGGMLGYDWFFSCRALKPRIVKRGPLVRPS